ncbi:hypothetical protein SCLCIDRAFT_30576 [Scleroderma citrinum Foug A]|uniref:Uncharacterized protein n=1 Tax=Scleroderma citrinum Foug A TaxID=1036808 RepID=A0A0C3DGG6_9AGAM|nr:hypothetical protein SCLCIDRAFT_30576 [Scleroderma citrinum Foug A]
MVKIPELAEDGQNWKIYRAKFLEVAATFDCLEVLAGRPYKGDDWDGCNALLCCMFMETVAPSIYFKIHCRTMHENFKYLTKRFCDNESIPRANELQHAGTATVAETPDNCPTSADAATERHVHAKLDEEDLTTTTKDLTRGTEDVDNGNVGCQDPRKQKLWRKALVLRALRRQLSLPIDGKPNEWKQEAADSVVTATCTNGMAKMAKPTGMIVDVDRTPMLGGEPAARDCGVDEGDGTEREGTQLQQMKFLCEEIIQRNKIANRDVPIAYRLPLKGEWSVYTSGEASDPKVDGIESEGREGVTSEQASVDKADGSAGRRVEPADVPNEMDTLVTISIKMEDPDSGDIPRVYLGGTKHLVLKPNSFGDITETSSACTDIHSAGNETETSEIETKIISNR